MMKSFQSLVYLVLSILMLIPLAIAQESADVIEPADPDMMDLAAHISFPPPVYVVRDSVDIRGAVTLPTMRNFFVEFRPLLLDTDMTDDEEAADNQWFPATLPRIESVVDDVLGTWNTVTLRDGLYEIRLNINTGGEMPAYFRVSPIRVENNPPDFMEDEMMAEGQTAVEMEPVEEEEELEPTATPDPSPRVVAIVNSNVRAGDSTDYQVIGHLLSDQSAKVKGISAFRSGWFYIELPNGRTGFIHPNIVRTEGELTNLPRINPPPLPPTPIPIPTSPPPPASAANLVIANVSHVVINPHPAVCGDAYRIDVTVTNNGTQATNSGFLVEVKDSRQDGLGPSITHIGFGALAPGASQSAYGHLTQWQYYDELHHINLRVDSNNQVPESNESDNHHAAAPYILQRGGC